MFVGFFDRQYAERLTFVVFFDRPYADPSGPPVLRRHPVLPGLLGQMDGRS